MADVVRPDPARAEATIADLALTSAVASEGIATAEDLAAYRREYYDRAKKAKRADRQLLFLFFLMVIATSALAIRLEQNDTGLRDNNAKLNLGLYTACVQRANAQQAANLSREGLVQLALSGPNSPKDPVQRSLLAKQLRDGLRVPVEDCGPPPAPIN